MTDQAGDPTPLFWVLISLIIILVIVYVLTLFDERKNERKKPAQLVRIPSQRICQTVKVVKPELPEQDTQDMPVPAGKIDGSAARAVPAGEFPDNMVELATEYINLERRKYQ